MLKARVSYLTILKRKYLNLPLKVETDQFVISLVLPYGVSSCQNLLHLTPDCEANRDGADAESPSPLFFHFSVSFKNSS